MADLFGDMFEPEERHKVDLGAFLFAQEAEDVETFEEFEDWTEDIDGFMLRANEEDFDQYLTEWADEFSDEELERSKQLFVNELQRIRRKPEHNPAVQEKEDIEESEDTEL